MISVFEKIDSIYIGILLKTNSKGMDMYPFHYIKDNNISDNKSLRATAVSAYSLLKTIGIIGIVLTITICGFQFTIAKNGKKLDEVKKKLAVELAIGVVIFGFVWIAGIIFSISKKVV